MESMGEQLSSGSVFRLLAPLILSLCVATGMAGILVGDDRGGKGYVRETL